MVGLVWFFMGIKVLVFINYIFFLYNLLVLYIMLLNFYFFGYILFMGFFVFCVISGSSIFILSFGF